MSETKNFYHPKFLQALRRIQECNAIEYAAYRTAAKMRVLQRTLSSKFYFHFFFIAISKARANLTFCSRELEV